ncbi:MAG: deoxyribodipyrimidine photolyase [Deltaproteobacteria bacterium]|nr:deoxyribodipyrimidine photolyase [Deltaproteobacteria bacterium]
MTSRAADVLLSQLLDGRVKGMNDASENPKGAFVLLWLQGQRRLRQNLAYAHAQRRANELSLPLVVYEALRHDYPHASDRFHRFVLEGAPDNAADARKRGLAYAFYLQRPQHKKGALLQLSARARVVVTDWLPTFIHPAQTKALAKRVNVRVEAVDAAGVVPLSNSPQLELAARTIRPKIHRALPQFLVRIPEVKPKVDAPAQFDWGFELLDMSTISSPSKPAASGADARAIDRLCASLPIDHSVAPVDLLRGGTQAALARLKSFLAERLPGYDERRNQPSESHTSWLSPYLHFGHLGPLEIALAAQESDAPAADKAAFLEELIVRRELALNLAARSAHTTLDPLPNWARQTLADHASDPRPALLTDSELERSESPDPVWNAAQRQLVREGRIHGYLRMLWGKSLLLWSTDAAEAFRRMMWLNDKYALDGRDANSYCGFLWCLGVHDRPFPERAIFGTVRSMTSRSTMNKFEMEPYLARYAP